MTLHAFQTRRLSLFILFFVNASVVYAQPVDPLPSWRNTANKKRIIEYVQAVSMKGSADFVPTELRIATFDMDGTLIVEKPKTILLEAVIDYLQRVAQESPSLQKAQPYQAVFENDQGYINSNIFQLMVTAYSGYTQSQFSTDIRSFVDTEQHPRFKRPYTDLFYQPMLELIQYLRDNAFRVFVVSGSYQQFVRTTVRSKIPLPNSHLIGTQIDLTYQSSNGKTSFSRDSKTRDPVVAFAGKPKMIELHIGEQPILAFGNNIADQQMFEWTSNRNNFRHLVLWLEHDDPDREYVYESKVSGKPGWLKVSMKDAFSVVFK